MHFDAADYRANFSRYRAIIDGHLNVPIAFEPVAEDPTRVQIERGLIYPRALRDPRTITSDWIERLIQLASLGQLDSVHFIDALGHHRAVYGPLLIYCWLMSFRIGYETLPRAEFGRWDEAL